MYTVKLGWGFVKPIARKTNERFQSLRYSLHAETADSVCNTLVPETGPPLWKPFLLPARLRPRFRGRFLAPRKSKQELLDGPDARISSICWRQPSFCNASRHGHTHIRIMLWGDMAQKLFWISEKGPSGAARSHANLLRSGSMPPLQRFCQQAVLRASWEKCVACNCCRASRPRALECTVYGQSAKRDVIPYLHAGLRGVIGTYEGHNQGWEGRNPFFTCGLELGRNRDVRGSKPQMGRT